jgi:hypothetical protein
MRERRVVEHCGVARGRGLGRARVESLRSHEDRDDLARFAVPGDPAGPLIGAARAFPNRA